MATSQSQSVDIPHGPTDVEVDVLESSDYAQVIELHGDEYSYVFAVSVDDHHRFTAQHSCTRQEGEIVEHDDIPQWVFELLREHGIHEVDA